MNYLLALSRRTAQYG